jgi:hypothetical protein
VSVLCASASEYKKALFLVACKTTMSILCGTSAFEHQKAIVTCKTIRMSILLYGALALGDHQQVLIATRTLTPTVLRMLMEQSRIESRG